MSRFASLSSPNSRVRGQLQTRLYYAREKNREARIAAQAPVSFAGAKVGTVGDDGALPTGWTANWADGTYEVLEIAHRDNLEAIKIKVSGTNSSGANAFPDVYLPSFDVEAGQKYSLSCVLELLDYNDSLVQAPRFGFQERSDSAFVDSEYLDFPTDWTGKTIDLTVPATATFAGIHFLANTLADGATLSATFQVANIRTRRTG